MSNQSGRQAAIRTATSVARPFEGDWHELFDAAAPAIPAGTFNERLLAWINQELTASYDNLPSAKQAYAENAGFYNWDSIDTLVGLP